MCGKGWMGIHSSERNKGQPRGAELFSLEGTWGYGERCSHISERNKGQPRRAERFSLNMTQAIDELFMTLNQWESINEMFECSLHLQTQGNWQIVCHHQSNQTLVLSAGLGVFRAQIGEPMELVRNIHGCRCQ